MASSFVVPARQKELEDPLAHLPCSTIVEYRKGQVIYNHGQSSTSLYLVMDGKVKISRVRDDGQMVVIDIYKIDDFFGEPALLKVPHYAEQATALEGTKLMMWTASPIEEIVMRRPQLGIALSQILAQRIRSFGQRMASFSADNVQRRLARSLIRFSEHLGTPQEDGSVRMVALTHQLLSQYVGTSREIISYYMNQFRLEGRLQYSRKSIILRPGAFCDWLQQNASSGQRTAASASNGS